MPELIPQKGDAALARRFSPRRAKLLAATAFDHASLESALRAAAERLGVKAGPMFQPIRVAVCGRKNAPPLFETMEVLGRDFAWSASPRPSPSCIDIGCASRLVARLLL